LRVWASPAGILLRKKAAASARNKAASEIAEELPTRFANPRVRRTLRRNRKSATDVRQYFVAALLLAAQEARQPQRIRLGRRWVKHNNGDVSNLAPVNLMPPEAARWLIQRARQVAERMILDDAVGPLPSNRSPRERELEALLQRDPNRSRAAAKMGITNSTLRVFLHRVKRKSGLPSVSAPISNGEIAALIRRRVKGRAKA
jgi:hypothetical protein